MVILLQEKNFGPSVGYCVLGYHLRIRKVINFMFQSARPKILVHKQKGNCHLKDALEIFRREVG